MKQSISLLLIILVLFTGLLPISPIGDQSYPMTDMQLQGVVGGKDVVECTALLLSCLAAIGPSWWGSLICAGLSAYCLGTD